MIWVPFKNLWPHGQKEHSPESVTPEELRGEQGGEEEEPHARERGGSKEAEAVGQNDTPPGNS